MDTGKGRFEILKDFNPMMTLEEAKAMEEKKIAMEEAHPNHGGWFRVGEIVEIKGSRFRVKSIKPDELRLKLLPKE